MQIEFDLHQCNGSYFRYFAEFGKAFGAHYVKVVD